MAFSTGDSVNIILEPMDGEASLTDAPFDAVLSPIKPAHGWLEAPEGAKEVTVLYSGGLLRRPALILQNEQGVYDHIALYKNKKAAEPIVVLYNNDYKEYIIDEAICRDQSVLVSRHMRLLSLEEDGSALAVRRDQASDPTRRLSSGLLAFSHCR